MEINMRTFKMLSMCGLLLISQECTSSTKYYNADDIADKVFGKQEGGVDKRSVTTCGISNVDVDVANRLIDKFNQQSISCENNGGFSINGKVVNGVLIRDMPMLIRDGVFSCQDYTKKDIYSPPERNSCVIMMESDVDFFLLTSKDKRIKSFPIPYDIAISRTSLGGRFTDFKLWANYALFGEVYSHRQ